MKSQLRTIIIVLNSCVISGNYGFGYGFDSPVDPLAEVPISPNYMCSLDTDCSVGVRRSITATCRDGSCLCQFPHMIDSAGSRCVCDSTGAVYHIKSSRCSPTCDPSVDYGWPTSCTLSDLNNPTSDYAIECTAGAVNDGGYCFPCFSSSACVETVLPAEGVNCVDGRCVCSPPFSYNNGLCLCPDDLVSPLNGSCITLPGCTASHDCLPYVEADGVRAYPFSSDAICGSDGLCTCQGQFKKVGRICGCKLAPIKEYRFDVGKCACTTITSCFKTVPVSEPYDGVWAVLCANTGDCICSDPYVLDPLTQQCVCKSGLVQDPTGICRVCSKNEHCASAELFSAVPDIICPYYSCICPEGLLGGGDQECRLCTANSECSPYETELTGITCSSNGCVCGTTSMGSQLVLYSGKCGCADVGFILDSSGECIATDSSLCVNNIDCVIVGSPEPSNGVTCEVTTGRCRCSGDFEYSDLTQQSCRCKPPKVMSSIGTCGVCVGFQNYECLSRTATSAVDSPFDVICGEDFKCTCTGDYELNAVDERCRCKSQNGVSPAMDPITGMFFIYLFIYLNQTIIKPITGYCFVECTTDESCFDSSSQKKEIGEAKCNQKTKRCECGFSNPEMYNLNYVLLQNNKCKYELYVSVAKPTDTELVDRFCSVDLDCVPGFDVVPAGVSCSSERGICICTGDYESVQGTVCAEVGTPEPQVNMSVSLLYADMNCQSQNKTKLMSEINTVWAKVYNISESDIISELKCGSIGVRSRLKILATLLKTHSRKAFKQLLHDSELLSILGEPSAVQTDTGTSLCPISFPVKASESFLGVCQATVCAEGYTLLKSEMLSGKDWCYDLFTTPQPPTVRSIGKPRSETITDTIIVSVSLVFILAMIIFLSVLHRKYASRRNKAVYAPLSNGLREEPENELFIKNAPDMSDSE